MRIISFSADGIQNAANNGFYDWLNEQGRRGEQADLIFMDLDKTLYEPIYDIVKEHNLLKPGGLLLCDNVLYRGLTAQLEAGEDISGRVTTSCFIWELSTHNSFEKGPY